MQPTGSAIKKKYYAGEYLTVFDVAGSSSKEEASYWAYQLFKFRAFQEVGKF